jgi:uncharacterized protein (DUF111 family)
VILETNIDDMNPQVFEIVEEKLFAAGALDVWIEHIQMKKNRPAFKLSCLATAKLKEELAKIILEETTSLGVRFYVMERYVLKRTEKKIKTKYGPVRVKVVTLPSGKTRVMPEYEDCKRIAHMKNIPFIKVYNEMSGSTS